MWGRVETRWTHEDVCASAVDLLSRDEPADIFPPLSATTAWAAVTVHPRSWAFFVKAAQNAALGVVTVSKCTMTALWPSQSPIHPYATVVPSGGNGVGFPAQVLSPFLGWTESPSGILSKQEQRRRQ